MRDVAALAGVGVKTVSRVVNDVPTVAPELVQRVRAAAEKLGYRPNLTAASLRRTGGRTNTIGLLLEDVSNPFSSAVHRAVEDHARHRDVLVLAGSLDEDPRRERELARTLIDRRVDGLIIMTASQDHRYVVPEQQAGTSFVFIDRLPSPLLADAIISDNRGGAQAAVRHLLRTHCRTVAYFGDDPSIPTARQRFLGFHDALAQAGLRPDAGLIRHGLRRAEEARRAALDLLASGRPEGVFSSQNLVTIGVVAALHELGLQHPIAHVGFDDIPLAAETEPGGTGIAQGPAEAGRRAAGRRFEPADRGPAPPHHTTPPTPPPGRRPAGPASPPAPERADNGGAAYQLTARIESSFIR